MTRKTGIAIALVAACAAWTGGLSETGSFAVGGEGGWDLLAVDDSTGRVFLSHSETVVALDGVTGKVLGSVAGVHGAHGIALDIQGGRGFATAGKIDSVLVFDLKTYSVTGRVATGGNPDAILFDPASHRVFCFNGKGSTATVIDASTLAVVGTVALPGKPELPVSDGAGKIWVNLEDKSALVSIDAKSLLVGKPVSLSPGEEPTGLAIDVKSGRLFSACGNGKMVVVDAAKGKVIASLPIGKRPDGAVFDPATRRAFSSNGEGSITAVQEVSADSFAVAQSFPTRPSARTIAFDPVRHRLYLPWAQMQDVPGQKRPTPKPGTFAVLAVSIGD